MQRDRGQSSPMAAALLVGLVIAGAFTVVLFGGVLVEDLSGTAESERAAQEMTHFASEAAAVALGSSQQRSVAFDASEGQLSVEPTGSWICLRNGSVTDREFILPESGSPDESCHDSKTFMGTARYDTGQGSVAYEGGGVWRKGEDGESRMVSPPEFHYRDETLTLPVVQVDGAAAASGSNVELTATAGQTERVDGIRNPLSDDSGRVYVTVGSTYYEAWGEFIAQRTAGRVVELDHDNETVTVELVVPSPPEIEQAIYASGEGSQAVALDSGLVDSYSSDDAPPRYERPDHNGSHGDVVTDGGVSIEDEVRGDVYTVRQGGPVVVDDAAVDGDINGQQSVDLDGADVNGSVRAEDDVVVGSDSTIGGDVHTQGQLDMDTGTVEGDIYADDGLVLDDDSGSPTVDGEVHADGAVDVSAGVFRNATYVNGSTTIDEATFEDEVHVDGTLTADEASFDDDVHVDGDIDQLAGSDDDATDVEGSVHVTGDATLSEVTITGDLHVDGELTCDGESDVQGRLLVDDADASSECPASDGAPSTTPPDAPDAPGSTEPPSEPVIDPPAVELPDDDEFDEVPDDCREGGNADGDAIVIDGRTCDLDPGTYNVSRIDVDGDDPDTVNLDLRTQGAGGSVELYVGGDVSISESANVSTGDNGHHNATELELNVYDEDASVDLSSNVTGVVNAPGTTVDIDDGAHVFGAVIAEDVSADGGGGVHYDRALSGRTAGAGQGDTPTIRYLHVTTNEMTIED